MNLAYILKQFRKIKILEDFVSCKFLSKFYDKTLSVSRLNKNLSHVQFNDRNNIIDDDVIHSIISNNVLPKMVCQKINKHKQFIKKELIQSPKKTINYRIEPLNSKRFALIKSNSQKNLNQITINKFALQNSWFNINNHKSKPIILKNTEKKSINKTSKQCLSLQFKDTTLEDHKTLITYLKKSLKKEFAFTAQTMPKVTLEENNKRNLFSKKILELFEKNDKSKPIVNFYNGDRTMIFSTLQKKGQSQLSLSSRTSYQNVENNIFYREIERNNFNFSKSVQIKAHFFPLLKKNQCSQTNLCSKLKYPLKQVKNRPMDLFKSEKVKYLNKAKDQLLLIIRPNTMTSINLKSIHTKTI